MYKKESPLGWAQPSAGNRGAGAGTDTRCFLLIASVSRLSVRVSCNISEGSSGIGDGEFSPPLSDFGPRDSGRSGLHLLSTGGKTTLLADWGGGFESTAEPGEA